MAASLRVFDRGGTRGRMVRAVPPLRPASLASISTGRAGCVLLRFVGAFFLLSSGLGHEMSTLTSKAWRAHVSWLIVVLVLVRGGIRFACASLVKQGRTPEHGFR